MLGVAVRAERCLARRIRERVGWQFRDHRAQLVACAVQHFLLLRRPLGAQHRETEFEGTQLRNSEPHRSAKVVGEELDLLRFDEELHARHEAARRFDVALRQRKKIALQNVALHSDAVGDLVE